MSSNTFFLSDDQQRNIMFYSDAISTSIFGAQIAYLSKYSQTEIQDYSSVLWSENFVKQAVTKVVKTGVEKLADIKRLVSEMIESEMAIDGDSQKLSQQSINTLIACISQAIFNRWEEIKSQHILDAVSLGSLCLVDVNWKITKTVSSDGRSFVGQKLPYLFKLVLYLRQNRNSEFVTKQVSLELTKVQLRQFLAQIKTIKKQL